MLKTSVTHATLCAMYAIIIQLYSHELYVYIDRTYQYLLHVMHL